jgi:hypothetical protein
MAQAKTQVSPSSVPKQVKLPQTSLHPMPHWSQTAKLNLVEVQQTFTIKATHENSIKPLKPPLSSSNIHEQAPRKFLAPTKNVSSVK